MSPKANSKQAAPKTLKTLWKMRPMPAGQNPLLATTRLPLNTALIQTTPTEYANCVGDALVDHADTALRARKPALKGTAIYGAEIAVDARGFLVTLAYLPEDVAGGALMEIFD